MRYVALFTGYRGIFVSTLKESIQSIQDNTTRAIEAELFNSV